MVRKRLDTIQALRGVAATLVAGFHLNAAQPDQHADGLLSVFSRGEVGVDIFFVISGFIIYYSSNETTSENYFIKSRFWRIFPPYWAILTLYVLASWSLWILAGQTDQLPSIRSLIVSYFLLPYPDYIISIAWTLVIEIAFYIAFSITFLRYNSRCFFIFMFVWVVLSQLYKHQNEFSFPPFDLLLNTLILEFFFGAMIARMYIFGAQGYRNLSLLIGSLWVCVYLFYPFLESFQIGREIVLGIPAALIIYGLLGRSWRIPEIFILWGESSYILYLIHILFYSVVGNAIEITTGFNVYTSDVLLILMLLSIIFVSMMANRKIEQPYQAWYRARMLGRPLLAEN